MSTAMEEITVRGLEKIETTMKFRVVMMPPEVCAHLLKNNHPDNRRMKPKKIDQFARDMRNGNWRLTHQGIAVCEDGLLVDGQNRCQAGIDAEVPFPTVLVTGVPRKAIAAADCGSNRTVADAAKISGNALPHGGHGFAAVGRCMACGVSPKLYLALTRQDHLEFMKTHRRAINFSFEVTGLKNVKGITQASVRAALARAYYRRGCRDEVARFGRILVSGLPDNAEKDRACLVLRNWLQSMLTTGQRRTNDRHVAARPMPYVIYAKASYALDAFLRGEAITRLHESSKELFPLPAGGDDLLQDEGKEESNGQA